MQWSSIDESIARLPRRLFALIAAAALGVILVSVVLTEVLDLHPCPLCIFQRFLYLVIGALALIACTVPLRFSWTRWLALVALLPSLAGAATAAYQSWAQLYPDAAPSCYGANPSLIERFVDWLGLLYPAFFMPTGFCTSMDGSFLSLTIANWSLLIFLGLSAVLLWIGFLATRASAS